MDDEIQLISDGDGLAVIGTPVAVQKFIASEELTSRNLSVDRLGSALGKAAGLAQVGSELAANSGQWVKLTKESAQLVDKYGLRTNAATGISTGVLKGKSGQINGFVEFAKGPASLATNPAVLAGAAGIMAQVAMQQTIDEITDYLAAIDAKVDDVLRAQKDAVLADMIGVDLAIEEAMTIRSEVGRVSDITWSKIQSVTLTIARTQGYALRQLDALAEKLEKKSNIPELAALSKDAIVEVNDWLAVIARCCQLQEAVAVLELDRVLETAPEELDRHRIGLKVARRNRLKAIASSTENLIFRVQAAAARANNKVLLHPTTSRTVVQSSNDVTSGVVEFQGRLGLNAERDSVDPKSWLDAATEVRDMALETAADGVGAAGRFGVETIDRAKSITNKLTGKVSARGTSRREIAEAVREDRQG